MRSIDVLCIGHIAYDMIFSVDGFPQENEKVKAADRSTSGGGPAANAACLCASWGATTMWVGHVGDDSIGQELLTDFSRIGVDCSRVVVRPDHPTPLSAILVNRNNGSRTIINHRKPKHVRPDETSLRNLNPKVILIDGHEPLLSEYALRELPDSTSILDGGSLRELSLELAKAVDYAVVSEVFAAELTGISSATDDSQRRRCACVTASKIGTNVAVTFGEFGTWFVDGDNEPRLIPALDVRAIDTTAAGDLYHGACAWALANGYPFADSLRIATIAAGLSVCMPGGRASIPSLDRVLDRFTDRE